ncbi:FAD-binding oxidoreductase [Chryseobacterium sp.]|nr:FAD-binding oxidoreductase [Chryseobacterium sp.]
MKNVDYIIVGGGYAALFFAHQLVMNGNSFLLFSDGCKGASRVSAGIVNPLVLKKFTTFWLAQEQIEFFRKTLTEIQTYTGNDYLIDEQIHRLFHDKSERNLWLSKSETEELGNFLDPEIKFLETIKNPFGTGRVNLSARLNVEAFFTDFFDYFKKNDSLSEEKFEYERISGSSYGDINFRHIVFCEGMGVRQNPFFSHIPVIPNKGHHLKVKLSVKLNHKLTLKKKHFLFPLDDELYYYGGTYDPNERPDAIDDFAEVQLRNGLSEFYPHEFEVAEVKYGFRPTVKDRRPILGNHPGHENFYVFNGLGARGVLSGCYFSKELFDHIENGKPLMPEVDVKRF